jgi:hypothetical protein
MTEDQFSSLAGDGTVLDGNDLDAAVAREQDALAAAMDRLDEGRDPAGVYTDPEPLDETDAEYLGGSTDGDGPQPDARI